MNCGSNALFVARWGQMHLHIHHHLLLHPDYSDSPQSHIQFCFLTVAAKAKTTMNKSENQTKTLRPKKYTAIVWSKYNYAIVDEPYI